MADHHAKDWRELCDAAIAALAAQDTDDLLQVLQELDVALGREDGVRPKARAGNGTRPSNGRRPRETQHTNMHPQRTHRSLGGLVDLEQVADSPSPGRQR